VSVRLDPTLVLGALLDTCRRFERVSPARTTPRFLPRGLIFGAVLVVLTVVYGTQLILVGNITSWGQALWLEAVYWTSWSLLALGVFSLCRWLHAGERRWSRYVAALFLGATVVVLLHPLLFQGLRFGTGWLGWKMGIAGPPPELIPALRRASINLIGPSIVLYIGTLLAWHAAKYYRDLQERQLQSANLEATLRLAQLQALRSQLNPHFLFNTLHSIAELVHESPPRAEQMLLRLSDLLRKALRSSNTLEVPLAEEVEFVRGYLEIEQMRLGERLSVTWEIAPDSLGARVPSLLLQPLVENAIQHGIAPLTRAGTLLIRTWRTEGFMHLQVRDNGVGLTDASQAAREAGVGLVNTRSRLQELYGEHYRFELIDGNGLSVEVRFPFREGGEAFAALDPATQPAGGTPALRNAS
jgi:two-component system, LytTR family, sensor kinase